MRSYLKEKFRKLAVFPSSGEERNALERAGIALSSQED
jgi:hypothetical protein